MATVLAATFKLYQVLAGISHPVLEIWGKPIPPTQIVWGQLLMNWNRRISFQQLMRAQKTAKKSKNFPILEVFMIIILKDLQSTTISSKFLNKGRLQCLSFQFCIVSILILTDKKMGAKLSLCQAITTPDVYVKLETPQKELQIFFNSFPQIQNIFTIKLKDKAQKIVDKYVARKFVQGIYVGAVNGNALPHSEVSGEQGIFMYEAGFFYLGGMKNGKRAGQGMLINEDGEYYTGQWSNNNPNGSGEYVSTQSSRSYRGQWKQGLQHGQGTQQYDDLSIYSGTFTSGSKDGKGRLTYPDGTYYQGQFSNNTITGYGICKGKFHKYQGQWLNGKMHGTGASEWNDEKGEVIGSYLGQYRQGLKHGYGEYRWDGKKVYKGRWEDGEMCSEGVVLNYEA